MSKSDDTISRKMAIDVLSELREKTVASDSFRLGIYYAIEEIKNVPSAQPHGKWILETYQIRCSNCNKLFSDNLFPSNYCPNCGARMDGESDEMQ